jgi:hypothetical protein
MTHPPEPYRCPKCGLTTESVCDRVICVCGAEMVKAVKPKRRGCCFGSKREAA